MAMTFTYDETGPIWKIIAVWTCDASGDAAATTKKITGSLIKGVTDPGAAGQGGVFRIAEPHPMAKPSTTAKRMRTALCLAPACHPLKPVAASRPAGRGIAARWPGFSINRSVVEQTN